MVHLADSREEARDAGRPLEIGHFDCRVGQSFVIDASEGGIELTLLEAQELPQSPREGGGFRLGFEGPPSPVLPQAIYSFLIGDEQRDIFIVSLGPGAGGKIGYEAIFF